MTPINGSIQLLAIFLTVWVLGAAGTLAVWLLPRQGRNVVCSVLAVLTVCFAPLGLL